MSQTVSRSATLLVVCTAHFLMPFMMSAVGVALPAIGREFAASARQLGLVETTYVLSASIFLLTMGRLGDIHGRRRVFQNGIALFTLAGGLLSQAWSIESLIAFRFLQGMGGAMVMSTSLAIVVSVFPGAERGKALGIAVAAVYAGISCGPLIGGTLVAAFGWRAIFYCSVPLGLAAFLVTLRKLRGEWAEAKGEPFDWRGSLVYAAGILLLISGASNLEQGYWAWGLLGLGVIVLALFVALERRCPFPLLNITLLTGNRVFALSNLAALFNYAATFGVTFFLSLYLQYVKGFDPRQAGLILILQPVTQSLLSPACGRLSDRIPAPWVATAGMALCAAGLGLAASVSASSPLGLILALLTLLGLGFALFSSPNMSVILGAVAPRYLGVATGLSASMRTLGMMTSMTIITIIFSVLMGDRPIAAETLPDFLRSMRSALLVFCGLCVVGIFCSVGRAVAPRPPADHG
ncbi:MFS transporter [Desulfuromonas carbonis]|uniref:MFS transporter n=1 Tax=Desulfuromonas sp. DDH964 TaxID=1823759 RepID=UPI00078D3CDF|nr:MFS transporter [Desulfuromonas sp. DDH964]AMV71390.1 RND family multidrug resistance efflux pump inner membrane protein EmrB [Desulfuromonas sp. DDH964]